MAAPAPNHRLRPWYIGLLVIAVTDGITAYLFLSRACPAGMAPEISVILLALVFVVLPVIYLALMYVTLKSQP